MALTAKQRRFVDEYLVDLNATQAAIRAGYSAKTAAAVGHENLKKPDIAAAVQERQAKAAERAQITVDNVIAGLALEARREGEGTSHAARVSAWAALGKHLGMFKDKVEVSGPDGGPIEVSDARKRIAGRIAKLSAGSRQGGSSGGSDDG
ncbi:terminase small subunit [Zhengella mangrovi]|uniref:Terminase small subunit n=1 Tax=Zhengella mangrovi TaxID=1982044 RepID=A0A2G1QMG5_9HYPH|nr:terminase small subunit [Zhengella mangrovi]PHP66715.1 terminase small subunit [Zhengella mangrovi]